MTDEIFDDQRLEDVLRRELHGRLVPFDPARANEMISAATRAEIRRLPRVAAPLGTAAAVLAVGAGVAVFAANGPSGKPAPAGGPGRAPAHDRSRVLCAGVRSGSLLAPRAEIAPTAVPARRQERAARAQARKAEHAARRALSLALGSAGPTALPHRIPPTPPKIVARGTRPPLGLPAPGVRCAPNGLVIGRGTRGAHPLPPPVGPSGTTPNRHGLRPGPTTLPSPYAPPLRTTTVPPPPAPRTTHVSLPRTPRRTHIPPPPPPRSTRVPPPEPPTTSPS